MVKCALLDEISPGFILFSVSVFLSFFLLLSPQNLLTLVSYSNFCIPPPKKFCLFSFQQPGGNSSCQHVPYVYISKVLLYCMSTLYCPPLQTLSFKYPFSSVDVFSLETLCDHFCIVFPIVPNPLSPLMNFPLVLALERCSLWDRSAQNERFGLSCQHCPSTPGLWGHWKVFYTADVQIKEGDGVPYEPNWAVSTWQLSP